LASAFTMTADSILTAYAPGPGTNPENESDLPSTPPSYDIAAAAPAALPRASSSSQTLDDTVDAFSDPSLPAYDAPPSLEPWLAPLRGRPWAPKSSVALFQDRAEPWAHTHARLMRALLAHGRPFDPCADVHADYMIDAVPGAITAFVRAHVPAELRSLALAFACGARKPDPLTLSSVLMGASRCLRSSQAATKKYPQTRCSAQPRPRTSRSTIRICRQTLPSSFHCCPPGSATRSYSSRCPATTWCSCCARSYCSCSANAGPSSYPRRSAQRMMPRTRQVSRARSGRGRTSAPATATGSLVRTRTRTCPCTSALAPKNCCCPSRDRVSARASRRGTHLGRTYAPRRMLERSLPSAFPTHTLAQSTHSFCPGFPPSPGLHICRWF
jgi:hypothetical protein